MLNTHLREPIIGFAIGLIAAFAIYSLAHARDGADFASPQEVHEWFENLRQPDNPRISCCGDADAYWADDYVVENGDVYAIITDDRGQEYDEKVGRIPRKAGDRFIVPERKYKWDRGNPTGHGVVFLSTGGDVICYVPPGGV